MIWMALSYLVVIPLALLGKLPRTDVWLLTGLALTACIATLLIGLL